MAEQLLSAFEALKQELEGYTFEQAAAWLRDRVLTDSEHRLSGRDMSAAANLGAVWLQFPKRTQDLIQAALARLLSEYLADQTLSEEAALDLLYLCRELQPGPVGTQLQNLLAPFLHETEIAARGRFNALVPSVQSTLLEVLAAWRPPPDKAFWLGLAQQDPGRFALRSFFALAPCSWPEALEVLVKVPAQPDQIKALAFAADWLKAIVPPNSAWLQSLSQVLPRLQPQVAQTLREALAEADVHLPRPSLCQIDRRALHTRPPSESESAGYEHPFAFRAQAA
jgi:hypothetical protein